MKNGHFLKNRLEVHHTFHTIHLYYTFFWPGFGNFTFSSWKLSFSSLCAFIFFGLWFLLYFVCYWMVSCLLNCLVIFHLNCSINTVNWIDNWFQFAFYSYIWPPSTHFNNRDKWLCVSFLLAAFISIYSQHMHEHCFSHIIICYAEDL